MTLKGFFWHLWRLSLAALFLWWDLRVFLFYAFTILLTTIHHVNHLRALVRILSIGHDAKLSAACYKLGLTDADIRVLVEEINSKLSDSQEKSLSEDWRLVSGDWSAKW